MDYAIMQSRAIRPIKISRISKLSQNSTLERHKTISHCTVYTHIAGWREYPVEMYNVK